MQKSFSISVAEGAFHVHQWGHGTNVVVALHGFRQTGQAFARLAAHLPADTVLYAPDLPYHGKTVFRAPFYHPETLEDLIGQLLDRTGTQSLHLVGFSMGCHLAVGLALRTPWPFHQLTLMAPDTPITKWGWVSFRSPLCLRVRLYRFFESGANYSGWMDALQRWRIIDSFTSVFLKRTLRTSDQRLQLFGSWRSRSFFPFSFKKLRAVPLFLRVILGEQDPLIPTERLKKRLKGVAVIMVSGGHEVVADPVVFQEYS